MSYCLKYVQTSSLLMTTEVAFTNNTLQVFRQYSIDASNKVLAKAILGDDPLEIINVFRFKNGEIVEIWNDRLDVESNRTTIMGLKWLLLGLLIALISFIWALRLKKKLKVLRS